MASQSYTLEGTLREKFAPQNVSEKLTLQKFVVTTEPDGAFPAHVLLQIANRKIELLDAFSDGDSIKVHFNIVGKFSSAKNQYYTSLEAWKVEST